MSQQYSFGSGTLIGLRNDSGVNTPVQFGALQEVTVGFDYTNKELYGQYQFPLAVARGAAKVTGKAKTGQFNAAAFNSIFFGQTLTTASQVLLALNEAETVPATPYQITVTHSANFVADQGVVVASSGLPLSKVASGPATGQYSVASGVYTFAAADTTIPMLLSYTYTATTGSTIAIANQLMGTAPTFSIVFNETFNGNVFTLTLNSCMSNKLNFATKYEDFTMPEFDFSAFADAGGNIGQISLSK